MQARMDDIAREITSRPDQARELVKASLDIYGAKRKGIFRHGDKVYEITRASERQSKSSSK